MNSSDPRSDAGDGQAGQTGQQQEPAKSLAVSRLKMLALLAAFVGPLLLAAVWLSYVQRHGGDLGSTARGELIAPAFPLEPFSLAEAGSDEPFDQESLQGIWTMLYAPEGACEEVCLDNLYNMRQVRLALGHRMDRVQRVLLQPAADPVPDDILAEHPGLRVLSGDHARILDQVIKAQSEMESISEPVYLVDPFGNLMMRFPNELPPKMMLKDIKHLLRVSRIG